MQADSEATVLYTAQSYVDSLEDMPKAEAMLRLGPLIRCQHLSLGWLSAVASAATLASWYSPDSVTTGLLLGEAFILVCQVRRVQELLKLKILSRDAVFSKETHSKWPDSWFLSPRLYAPQDSVQLTWPVDVDQIREAAVECAQSNVVKHIQSDASTPVRGFSWRMKLEFNNSSNGVKADVYVAPSSADLYQHTEPAYSCMWKLTVDAGSKRVCDVSCPASPINWMTGYGVLDPLGFECMAWHGWRLGCCSLGSCRAACQWDPVVQP
jgi:hypothetical protein